MRPGNKDRATLCGVVDCIQTIQGSGGLLPVTCEILDPVRSPFQVKFSFNLPMNFSLPMNETGYSIY